MKKENVMQDATYLCESTETNYSNYDWKNSTAVGFMGCFFMNRFFSEYDRNREKYVRLELYQVKKDGTKSLKKDEISVLSIVSIKKVEE